MKSLFLSVVFGLLSSAVLAKDGPFSLEIVPEVRGPEHGFICAAADPKRAFYVVLTNNSEKTQRVFEYWNSWGYQAITFEMTLASGKKFTVTKKPQDFTRNFPSTYSIPPHGHQVFSIKFDKGWEGFPDWGKPTQTRIELKAIYTVKADGESKKQDVWVGSVASRKISVDVNHW